MLKGRLWPLKGSMILAGLFLLLQCGSQFDALLAPFSGLLRVNNGTAVPFTWSNVKIEIGGTTSTITLSNSLAGNQGLNNVSTLKLVVPNGMIGNEIDLGTGPAHTSSFTETTTNSAGATVSTEFKSTNVTGAATVFSLVPNNVEGILDAIFTDADGNTREVIDSSFSFSS